MKKITLLGLLIINMNCFAQQKTTGDVTLSTNMTANLTLNNTTQKATLKLTGPSDRWFALQFGSFGAGGGMLAGEDFVYVNGTTNTLVDGNLTGKGNSPNTDATQDWIVTSDAVTSGIRTIIAERKFSTGDAKDYTFTYGNSTIDFVWARRGNAGYALNNHGGNRGYNVSVPLSVTLGVEDFSLKTAAVYPNPSNGNFSIESERGLDTIKVYSQTGILVKTINVEGKSNTVDVSLKSLQAGIYLIELQNDQEKTWKKIIVN
ncbi:hypothetical protein DMB65_20185 [Flavobacterium cheongpyeongense]|jgi:Secretion system C-terminal sorting domain|uniref:DOMON domain-containing protein n=1 Tax=Flavobacterium cheongpyeongense TaxID=2212651 RepID=A0A2V4BJA7_9FLAO|nr:T9SS type A sorting domain-containing protein [Flavobacterium cheongpyeongense]PXY38979.1 hypothetical protein DMB65_20185 [Flavobacterium cheongpyeongense]